MELVSGETLAERVKRDGAVPVEEALTIAKQIAEALEAAHEKGIIHRDLKPANVKVTPEGKVKVLDFGLAKAFEGDATRRHRQFADAEHGGDYAGRDSGDGGVHEPGAGARQSRWTNERTFGRLAACCTNCSRASSVPRRRRNGHLGCRGES